MRCHECQKAGQKSRVFPGMSTTTSMYSPPYYDEEGVYHSHDPNTLVTSYSCSNGHTWTDTSGMPCPGCDWGKGA